MCPLSVQLHQPDTHTQHNTAPLRFSPLQRSHLAAQHIGSTFVFVAVWLACPQSEHNHLFQCITSQGDSATAVNSTSHTLDHFPSFPSELAEVIPTCSATKHTHKHTDPPAHALFPRHASQLRHPTASFSRLCLCACDHHIIPHIPLSRLPRMGCAASISISITTASTEPASEILPSLALFLCCLLITRTPTLRMSFSSSFSPLHADSQ